MEKVLLKTIIKQVRGVSYKPEDISKERLDGYIPLLRAGNIGTSNISNLNDLVYVRESNVTKQQYLQEGDILIAASSGSIDIVGKSVYIESSQGFTFGAFCKVIRPNNKRVNPKYISFYFQTDYYRKKISNLAQGANINNLKNEHIDNLEIPFSDLETQNKIVAILDKAKTILDKREETIKKYDELLRATFLEMFGDPCNPQRDDLTLLRNVIFEINSGWSPICEEIPRLYSNQPAILKQGAISKRIFDSTQNKLLPDGIKIKKAVYAEKGDLLFSRKNTPELVGAVAYIFEDYENLLLPDTIFNLKYNNELVSGVYLYFLFNNHEFRKKIQRLSVGQAESMSNISQKRLLELEIPSPDINKQLYFEEIVLKSYNSFFRNIQKSKFGLEKLLKNLSQQVFSERITIDIDAELEALINAIDLDKNDSENRIDFVVNDITFIQRLIDRLDEQQFEDKEQYDKAKYIIFRMMKEQEGLVKQVFKNNKVQLTLKNETA
jgi:type I restriction enzyme S subunit